MSCSPLTQSYAPKDCDSTAGVVAYILTPFSNMLTATVMSNVVTAITKTATFKKYSQDPEIADWKYTLNNDGKTGNYGYEWEASFQIKGAETLDVVELELLTKNKLVLIAEMANGTHYILGRNYGGKVLVDAFETGVAFNDFMGSKVTIKGRDKTKFLKVDSAIVAGLLV